MDTYDLILPHKQAVLAKGKNLVTQYEHEHIKEDIKKLELVVLSKYPDYKEACRNRLCFEQNYCYPYNMFVGRKS